MEKIQMKIINLVMIIGIISLIISGFAFSNKNQTGNSVKGVKEDVFDGTITNIKLSSGKLSGMGVYDRSCNMVGNGLTQCDAGIQTEEGLLNFNYVHDMSKQECIGPNDKLTVEILDTNGKARVTRG